jgi:FkbM family methyltransferase
MIKSIVKLLSKQRIQIEAVEKSMPDTGVFAELQRLCKGIKNPTIFDVGAHIGQTTGEFRRRFPNAQIFSFEPFPESFERLQANSKTDQGIHVFNYGLADQTGTFPFQSNLSSATNSLLTTDNMGFKTWGEGLLETNQVVQADFKTIDLVLKDLNIRKINILKLDVQGAEYRVVKGGAEALRDGVVDYIFSEIITQPTYIGQKRLDEALSVFYNAGFDLHNIFELSSTSDGVLRQFDAIFTRQKLDSSSKVLGEQ